MESTLILKMQKDREKRGAQLLFTIMSRGRRCIRFPNTLLSATNETNPRRFHILIPESSAVSALHRRCISSLHRNNGLYYIIYDLLLYLYPSFFAQVLKDTICYSGTSEKPITNAVKSGTSRFLISSIQKSTTITDQYSKEKTNTSQLLFSEKALRPFPKEIICILGITCCIKQVLSINF